MVKWLPAMVTAGAALIALSAAGLLGRAPKVTGEVQPRAVGDFAAVNVRTVGVSGCASAGCHGGSAMDSIGGKWTDRSWAGTASHWLAVDPHTKAYAALKSKLAADIMQRYAPGAEPTEDVRCLACHTNPSLADPKADARDRQLRTEGVSCEACHGDAGKWLALHTTTDRAAAYEQHGMAKLFDIGERAVACAGCHVGAPADESRGIPVRDMNHDMIAAGHPRLNFDFADYQRRFPHWKEKDASPEFEVKAWLVGRAAHAEAATRLTADRESRGKTGAASMPEFAEWNCVSCHHKLADGFASSSGKPAAQAIWPFTKQAVDVRALRMKYAAAVGTECVAVVDAELTSVNLAAMDRDTACQVYHGLAARERSRMKREGRVEPDAGFAKLAKALTLPRGNLDFMPSQDAMNELKVQLKK